MTEYVFFDIETHRVLEWDQLDEGIKRAFINHYYDESSYASPEEQYKEIAGLNAEFGRVICISFGYENSTGDFIKSHICSTDEKDLLRKAATAFKAFYDQGYKLAGHNILACDIPFLVKRYIINGMKVPDALNHLDVKPWELEDLDTMNLWKFGMYRAVSLEMLCACLGIPCKSETISGANLYTYPINEVPMDELAIYCDEDVESCYKAAKIIKSRI